MYKQISKFKIAATETAILLLRQKRRKVVMLQKCSFAVTVLLGTVFVSGTSTRSTGQELDFSKYTLTFAEEFETLDVSGRGPGTRWIAHTPWNGDFGDAIFVDPTPDFPFTIKNGMLRIEARRGQDGKWRSGLLASVDPTGSGFSQQFGYFEMRAKLPWGQGVWPAFWLIGLDRSAYTAEIDVMEHYGHAADRFTSSVHVWNRQDPKSSRSVHQRTSLARGSLYDRFNIYGVSIDAEWIRIFLNRQEVWRTKTPDEHKQPMYILVNLGLGGGWPIKDVPDPSYMYVDYIRVYAPAS